MRVLFVVINPSPSTYALGVPFSNNKTFLYLLNRAGLIDEKFSDLKDDAKLRLVYNTKFNQVYKFGLVNMINRPILTVSSLVIGEDDTGRRIIQHRKIKSYDYDNFIN